MPNTAKKYEGKFSKTKVRVPVQFGKLSKKPRICYYLGSIGNLKDSGTRRDYYRIAEGESSAGRFIEEYRWCGHKDGIVDIDSEEIWVTRRYTQYHLLPKEIREKIEGKGVVE